MDTMTERGPITRRCREERPEALRTGSTEHPKNKEKGPARSRGENTQNPGVTR